jgi:hypothetical protein
VILDCIDQSVFVHRISFDDRQSLIPQRDAFRRTNKRGDVMTSCQSLLNNFSTGSASRSNDKQFYT